MNFLAVAHGWHLALPPLPNPGRGLLPHPLPAGDSWAGSRLQHPRGIRTASHSSDDRLLPRKCASSPPSMNGYALFFCELCSTKASHSSAEGPSLAVQSLAMQSPEMQSPVMQSPPAAQGYSCPAAGYPGREGRASRQRCKAKPAPGRTRRPRTCSSAMPPHRSRWQWLGCGRTGGSLPRHRHTAAPGSPPSPRGAQCRCHPGQVPSPPVNQATSRVEGDFGCKQSPRPCRRNVGSNKGAFVQRRARPSAPGLALPHPGTALSPLLFPSIIRRSGGRTRMCPVSTSGCKELNSYQLLERRKQELLFTEKSDASPPAAPSPLPAGGA